MRRRSSLYPILLGAVGLSLVPLSASAQERTISDDPWCERARDRDEDYEMVCQVREFTLGASDRIDVDGHTNGGISVEGWDQSEILVRARVKAHARAESTAQEIMSEIEISTSGRIHAEGPRTGHREGWSVSYEVFVPRSTDVSLETMNGGIRIIGVDGSIDFRAKNGGVHLSDLAGHVRGRTTNGGLEIELTGNEWSGAGMDVETTNGGVRLYVPEDYSARIETGTTNGGMRLDFPVTVQGRIGRRMDFEVGRGGKTIRAVTTNGGVVIRRS